MNHTVKLYMHDSFLDAFANLPKKMQKRTREFMKKFKLDPTSSAINYEKIVIFKDKSLRTVRISGKYRAIIKAPKSGNGYHLLWVDNHDEAMDWAKNKVFEWNQNTQSFQMYDVPEKEIEVTENKDKITSILGEISEADLLAIGTPEGMIKTLRKITDIEQLNEIKENLPVDNYEYLYYLLEGIALEEIIEEINAGKNDENQEQSGNAQKHVYIITEDEELESMLSGDFSKWKVFLHPSQRNLSYRDYNGAMKITGGAGTGKTVCAMHRAKYLVNKIEIFDKPILFTTYTKSLTEYLKATMKDFDLSETYLHISNFDKLIYALAKDTKYNIISQDAGYLTEKREKEIWQEVLEYLPSDKDENFFWSEYNEVLLTNDINSLEEYLSVSRLGRSVRVGRKEKIDIWKAVENYKTIKGNNYSKYELCVALIHYWKNQIEKPFSHLICDETQDFSMVELSLMRVLVEEKANDLFLVGDPFQNIYSRKINFSKSGINIRGRRSRKLRINYRTTEEIKQIAIKTIASEKFNDFDGGIENRKGYVSLMHGNQPEYLTFSSVEEEEEHILKYIRQCLSIENISPSDICICARKNTVIDEIKRMLNKAEISYADLGRNDGRSKKIQVSTFHNLKGHEFKYLLVTNVSRDNVPLLHANYEDYNNREKKQYHKQERALYYVVFTRAIQGLLITGVGEQSDWF